MLPGMVPIDILFGCINADSSHVDPLSKHYIQASRATIKVQHLPISNLSIMVTTSNTILRVGIFYASGMLPLTIFRIVLIIIPVSLSGAFGGQ